MALDGKGATLSARCQRRSAPSTAPGERLKGKNYPACGGAHPSRKQRPRHLPETRPRPPTRSTSGQRTLRCVNFSPKTVPRRAILSHTTRGNYPACRRKLVKKLSVSRARKPRPALVGQRRRELELSATGSGAASNLLGLGARSPGPASVRRRGRHPALRGQRCCHRRHPGPVQYAPNWQWNPWEWGSKGGLSISVKFMMRGEVFVVVVAGPEAESIVASMSPQAMTRARGRCRRHRK